jgi:hypothetical protein
MGGAGLYVGMYMLWDLDVSPVPAGWQLADGTNGTRDLRNKFIIGAGSTYTNGDTGGTTTHTHTYTTTTGANSASQSVAGVPATTTVAANPHTHSVSGTTASANHLPPYLALTWIAYIGG